MRILVISSVPPTRCGIATYASQQIARLKEEGHAVTVAALDGEGVADLHFRLKQVAEIIRLTRLVEHYDRTILHYQHDFFFSGWDKRQLISHNLLLAELFGRGVEVVAHEVSYRLLEGGGGRLVQRSERYKWRSAKQITVHTPPEEARLRALVPGANIVRRDHQADFRPFRQADQAAVRAELDIQVDAVVYLCIGFIQHHKGFDRAMTAFALRGGLGASGAPGNSRPHSGAAAVGGARQAHCAAGALRFGFGVRQLADSRRRGGPALSRDLVIERGSPREALWPTRGGHCRGRLRRPDRAGRYLGGSGR